MPRHAVAALADILWNAEQQRRALTLPDPAFVVPDETTAYAVQADIFARRGSALLGFKLGGTVRPVPGDDRRSYGTLSRWHLLEEGGEPVDPRRFSDGRVEPEIALRLGRELSGEGHDRHSVAAHLDAVIPALEIADTRYAGFPSRLADNIADNSASGAVVFGAPVAWRSDMDLRAEGVNLYADDALTGSGVGADVMGDPLLALAWLAGRLARNGLVLPAGATVITGGITPALPLRSSQAFRAVFGRIGSVALRLARV